MATSVLKASLSLGICAALALGRVQAATTDWKHYAGGYGKTITYKWADVESASYADNVDNAAVRWNTFAGSPVLAFDSSHSANTYQVGNQNFGYTWYGLYTPYTNFWGRVTSFLIQINVYQLMLDGCDMAAVESSMAHEMGHAFALGDLEDGPQLMSHGRNRDTTLGPQDGDQTGVKSIWK
ncbi:MAG TPA: hypothetical protein VGK74_18785 [Symbiobacteriaceae bacterium]